MSQKIIESCPSCHSRMSIGTLVCRTCGIEIKGSFDIDGFSSAQDGRLFNGDLTDDEIEFIKKFLKYEGNITKLQVDLGTGYFAIKNKLNAINLKLGNKEESMTVFANDGNLSSQGEVSQTIIKLLERNGGKAICPMLRGAPLTIWLDEEGVRNSGFTDLVCTWEIFDAIVKKASELGGKMYKGDSAAQNGAKIGSSELPLDTIDSFISLNFYGASVGSSTMRRSTYYAAILAWAGICENKRSDGRGGYIRLISK